MRKAFTFSNVMSVLAVFIALGGTAVAVGVGRNDVGSPQLRPGAVRSADIANRQVKPIDTARSLGFDCPDRTRYSAGVCLELAGRPAESQLEAEYQCFQERRRLPSVGELQAFRFEPGVSMATAGEWTGEFFAYREPELLWGVLIRPGEFPPYIAPRADSAFPFRCVAPARG
jgi:hypothetical protein